MKTEGSLPHSQQLATCHYPPLCRVIPKNLSGSKAVLFLLVTCLMFYGEEVLVSPRTLKLEDHVLKAVRHCFSIHWQLPFISEGHAFHYKHKYGPLFLVICFKLKIF